MGSPSEIIPTLRPHESLPGFSRLVRIEEINQMPGVPASERGRLICSQLEIGNLLLLANTPFDIPQEDRELLLGRKQTSSGYHKNIAYRPVEDRVTGLDASEREEAQQLRRILRNYSQQAIEFVNTVLTPYANQWKLDYASFRPIEEKGRPARVHARNDLLHFDSFPTRPTNGARILRLFTNINPVQNRVWLTSQTFEAFGPRFAGAAGLQSARKENFLARLLRPLAGALHLSIAKRPPYDEFMHLCHNAMKEDENFQETTPKHRWEFPPNCSWLAFTDCVSHAVLEGQYALEQTFVIPQSVLVARDRSPLAILERVAGHSLTI
jgi:3-deoxy-D-manno-oct-2-ulosonic acid (Kdo) hydroxylase